MHTNFAKSEVMSVLGPSRDELRRTWGITPGYWLWPTPIKILFVIDGRIVLSSGPFDFGLGYVLDTLLCPYSWWVRFEVHIAKRDGALDEGAEGADKLDYTDFKFTQDHFNLDDYDQVWFFGHRPFEDSATDNDIAEGELDPAELKLVAEWMDRGGGVFAVGDHSILGASLCSKLPRVRTMRKWRQDQGVPTKKGPSRNQTLQPTTEIGDPEGDILLQPIEPVYRRVTGALPFYDRLWPHPLLCSRYGVIDRFPDHMHEGEVVADDDVKLDQLFNILDYERPEYPFVIPTVLGSAPLEGELPTRRRPRPHVIAYGRTTNPDFVPPILERVITGDHPLRSKRFGLISAYDGDSVGLGRVVVDSTWHHWFSMNLVGIAQGDSPAYQKMQDYYRNVGMWLATPAQRSSMLVSGTWGVLNGSPPMAFGTETEPWEIGERVLAAFGLTASPCLIREIVAPFLDDLELLAESSAPGGPPQAEPSWSGLPEDLINRALVGGIGSALLDLALDHQEKRARGQRPRVNPEAIRQRIVDGVARGHTLLRKSVQDAATSLTAVHAVLTKSAIPRPIDVRIPIEVRELRVVAETLQLPDASDPVLLDRHVTLTIRLKLDDSIVAHQIIESVELPAFNERGSVIDLSRDVAALAVQTGESLSIEVIAGSWTSEEADPELIRFTETVRGDASKWIGKNLPARSQAWRLWYRIEEAKAPSY